MAKCPMCREKLPNHDAEGERYTEKKSRYMEKKSERRRGHSFNEREGEEDSAPAFVYNEATVTIASPEMIGRLPDRYRPQAPPFDDAIGG